MIQGPAGRLCGRSEDDLYCTAAYPFDHIGDSAINTTRVVPDSGDYLERLSCTKQGCCRRTNTCPGLSEHRPRPSRLLGYPHQVGCN
jgi:hypothetical protein